MPRKQCGVVYDRVGRLKPQLLYYPDEVIYSPSDVCLHELVPWREAAEVGQWLKLEDGGAARLLAKTQDRRKLVYWTACGSAQPSDPKQWIKSTGVRAITRGYISFVKVKDQWAPKRVARFVDELYRTRDPMVAFLVSMGSSDAEVRQYLRTIAPDLRKQMLINRASIRRLMMREDTQALIRNKIKEEMEGRGLLNQALATIDDVLRDNTVDAKVRVTAALETIKLYKSVTSEGEGHVVTMPRYNAEELTVLRRARMRRPVVEALPGGEITDESITELSGCRGHEGPKDNGG